MERSTAAFGREDISLLGSEPSWPHGPAKAISRDALPSRSAFCPRTSRLHAELPGKVVTVSPVTVAAVLQHSQSAKLQKKQLEHRLGLLKHRSGRRSESPVTWQELAEVSRKQPECLPGPDEGSSHASTPYSDIMQHGHVLRQQHHLSEPDVQRLYRVLHIYSLGFHQVMSEITSKAEDRQQLLSGVWKAFLQLWEEALQISSESEVLQLIQDRDKLTTACLAAQDSAFEAQQQSRELHDRVQALAGGAISRMTHERALQGRISQLELELQAVKAQQHPDMSSQATQTHMLPSILASGRNMAKQNTVRTASSSPNPDRTKGPVTTTSLFASPADLDRNQKDLQQALAAVEQKQVLLRQAYKLTTDAEAKCKKLEQQLATVQARCLRAETAQQAGHDSLQQLSGQLADAEAANQQLISSQLRNDRSPVDVLVDSDTAEQCTPLQQQRPRSAVPLLVTYDHRPAQQARVEAAATACQAIMQWAQLHLASDIQGVVQNHPATQHAESIAFPRVSASEGACLHPVAIKHGHIMQSDSRRNVAGVDKGGHCVAQLTQFCRDQSASTLSPQAATDHWQSGSITSSPLESERLSAVPQPGTGLAALQSSAAIAATATTMASAPLDQQGADSKAAHDHGQLQLLLKDLQSALIGLCSFD